MKPHYRLQFRLRGAARLPMWRVVDEYGFRTPWHLSVREACERMRAGLVI